jgi:hypothetical protein
MNVVIEDFKKWYGLSNVHVALNYTHIPISKHINIFHEN